MARAGAVQFLGRRPGTPSAASLQYASSKRIRGQAVCASISGPYRFEPALISDKKHDRIFRGSVVGPWALPTCDFHHQGAAQMLLARPVAAAFFSFIDGAHRLV